MIYNYNVYVHFYIQYEHNKYQTDNHILFGYFLQYSKYTADAYSQEVYSMYLSVVCFVCVYQCIHFKINADLGTIYLEFFGYFEVKYLN